MAIDGVRPATGALEQLYQEIVCGGGSCPAKSVTLGDIEARVANWKRAIPPLTSAAALPAVAASGARGRITGAASDALLGIGHCISRLTEGALYRVITPPIQSIGAGLVRAAGGLLTAALAVARVYSAAKQDLADGKASLPSARRETVVSMGGIGAGMMVGELGYLLAGGAAALSAPIAVVGAIVLGAALAAGYAANRARDAVGQWYDGAKKG